MAPCLLYNEEIKFNKEVKELLILINCSKNLIKGFKILLNNLLKLLIQAWFQLLQAKGLLEFIW